MLKIEYQNLRKKIMNFIHQILETMTSRRLS